MTHVYELQGEVTEWHRATFPDATAEQCALILAEETGEVIRCCLKMSQGIRTGTDWMAELRKEVGDVLISLCALSSKMGIELDASTTARFRGTVAHRTATNR